jgi:hypothetical protein
MLTCLAAASTAAARVLQLELQQLWQQQRQRQQQQDTEMVDGLILNMAASQIRLFRSIATVWSSSSGSSSSSSEELGTAALPVLNLALVLLDATVGRAAFALPVMDVVSCICDTLLADLRSSSSSSGEVLLSAGVQQLLQSEQLPKLLAATQALCVLALNPRTSPASDRGHDSASSNSGSGASSSQQPSTASSSGSSSGGSSSSSSSVSPNNGVQQGAEQLLVTTLSIWNCQAITREHQGVFHFHWQREHGEGSAAAALLSIAAVVQHMLPRWAAVRTDAGSSSSSSSSSRDLSIGTHDAGSSSSSGSRRLAASSSPAAPAVQPAQQRHQQYLPLLVLVAQLWQWAVVQVQLMQLVDSVGCKVELMKTLLAMLDAAGTVGARLHTAVNKALLQPVLQQLLPHLQGVLGTQQAAAVSSSSSRAAGASGNARPSCSSSSSTSSTSGTAGCSADTVTAAGSSSSSARAALELGLSTLLVKLAQGGEAWPAGVTADALASEATSTAGGQAYKMMFTLNNAATCQLWVSESSNEHR